MSKQDGFVEQPKNPLTRPGLNDALGHLRDLFELIGSIEANSAGDVTMGDRYRKVVCCLRDAHKLMSEVEFFRMIGGPLDGTTQAMPANPHCFQPDTPDVIDSPGYRLLADTKLFIHSSIDERDIARALSKPTVAKAAAIAPPVHRATVLQSPGSKGAEDAQRQKAELEAQGYTVSIARVGSPLFLDIAKQVSVNCIFDGAAPLPHGVIE